MPGLKPFSIKLSIRYEGRRLLEQTVASIRTLGVHGKIRLRRERNGIIVNWFTLLQSEGNSVSNDTWFAMLRFLISMPFNTKLSIRYWNWRLLEQILLHMIYDLLCLDSLSRILTTQNFSLSTVHLVLPQYTTFCTWLMSTLLAASSRRA